MKECEQKERKIIKCNKFKAQNKKARNIYTHTQKIKRNENT